MPNYDFVNKDSGDVETHFMSWKELDKFKEDNPHLERLITAPAIVGGLGSGGVKAGGGLDEVFAKTAEKYPDSPLADRYGKKSIKDIKTREVVNKHRAKWSKQ